MMNPNNEFSKMLTLMVIFVYFAVIVFSLCTWVLYRDYPAGILEVIGIPFMVVMGSYFGKSAYENGRKYENVNKNCDSEPEI